MFFSPYSLFNESIHFAFERYTKNPMQARKNDFQTPDGFCTELQTTNPRRDKSSAAAAERSETVGRDYLDLDWSWWWRSQVYEPTMYTQVCKSALGWVWVKNGKHTFMHSISPLSVHTLTLMTPWFYYHPANWPTAQAACRDRRSCCRRCSAWSRICADSVAHWGIHLWYIVVHTYDICISWPGQFLPHVGPQPSEFVSTLS